MTVVPFEEFTPRIAGDAVVLPGAMVIGDVRLGARSSVWYGTVLRADDAPISIGADSNVQDGSVVHADPGFSAAVGDRVTIGHGAIVHGATIEDGCLIGMRAVILNGARIGRGSVIAAGSVVREGQQIPPGSLAAGIPAQVKRSVGEAESRLIALGWRDYVQKAIRHRNAHRE
ncbi:MAG TPA: gamma carbonic anhydrase family protein [Mycobacteriales bacterium]|nr:gamma carbonic anhydrase family protein [Mycobacteriales bacterium]